MQKTGKCDSFVTIAGVNLKTGEQLAAAFVVDCSGARSKIAQDFLRERGFGEVESTNIDPGLNYQTRYFRVQPEVSHPAEPYS